MLNDEYVVNGAICRCKFGSAPGILKVTDNQSIYMNGNRTATENTLGNVFQGAGFTLCRKSFPSKPCTPLITSWSGVYDGVTINGSSSLLGTSKGTCALGCPDCITFQTTGQVAVPNRLQLKQAALLLQGDIILFGKDALKMLESSDDEE